MKRSNRHRRRWTPEEVTLLEDLLDEGHSLSRIASVLGRTVEAVDGKRMRLGIEAQSARGVSMLEAAKRLGLTVETIKAFIARRWLIARHPVRHDSSRQIIDDESILEFLADEAHWHEYDPHWIVDPEWREWALEVRNGLTFVTVDEAARVLCLTPAAVRWRIRRGRIRAVRTLSGVWMIRSDWLQTAPREPAHWTFEKRVFTPEEDDFLRLWRPFQPICHLAAALQRSETGVRNRCHRLGLTGPIVPHRERAYPSRRARGDVDQEVA